jgi:hypothetical protein
MRESAIEAYLVVMVERLGGDCRKHVSPGRNGVVDRIVILPFGMVWFIETKAPAGKLEPLQEYERDRLLALGARHAVLHTKAAVDRWAANCASELAWARKVAQ